MHTPGPWCFEAENGRAHPRVYGADNSLIAEVGNANLMRWEMWDHDARLIAAAPELLDVLTKLSNEVAGCWSAFEHELRCAVSNTNYQVMLDRLALAQAAIAKAADVSQAHAEEA